MNQVFWQEEVEDEPVTWNVEFDIVSLTESHYTEYLILAID